MKLFFSISGWLFGILILLMGIVNTFWGNDPFLGIGLIVLSFMYYPPVNELVYRKTGLRIQLAVKVITGLLLLWVCLGVGELFDKIDLMILDLF